MRLTAAPAIVALVLAAASAPAGRAAQSDLDAFMQAVMTRRDGDWRKLQQYIIDEREKTELRGPEGRIVWGERRDYTWYIRDGYFVRSPVRINGAAVSENDRLKYEARFLEREREREAREREVAPGADGRERREDGQPPARSRPAAPSDMGALLREGLEPQFISSAYFLRFQFDRGRYALVGRETLAGREVLRIEYYPTKLFEPWPEEPRPETRTRAQLRTLLNKGSRITLWIDPGTHQILQYTFDNVNVDFFPAQWLASVVGIHATMSMGEAFPEVWLPRTLGLNAAFVLAAGRFEVTYEVEYHDYRRADVSTDIRIPAR